MSEQGNNDDGRGMEFETDVNTTVGSIAAEHEEGSNATDRKANHRATGSEGDDFPKTIRGPDEIDTTAVTAASQEPVNQPSTIQERVQRLSDTGTINQDATVINDDAAVENSVPDTRSPAEDARSLLDEAEAEKAKATTEEFSKQPARVIFSVTLGNEDIKDSCLSRDWESRANSQDSFLSRASDYLQSAASGTRRWLSGAYTEADELQPWGSRRSGLPGSVRAMQNGTSEWLGDLKDDFAFQRPIQQVLTLASCALMYNALRLGNTALSEASSVTESGRRAFGGPRAEKSAHGRRTRR